MRKTGIFLSFVLILLICAGTVFAAGSQAATSSAEEVLRTGVLPRNETLFFNGILWGAVTRFNPYGIGGTVFGIAQEPVARQMIFETLFLFNLLDDSINPHIGDSYTWQGNNMRVNLRRDVHFNNGQRLTAADVVYSFTIHREYQTGQSGLWLGNILNDVVAIDDYTVEIRGNPQNFQPRRIEAAICTIYITSRTEWDRILREQDPARGTANSNRMAVAQYPMLNPVHTGPYHPLFWDETRTVVQRDDNYWGIAKFGRPPAPRYIAHNVFQDNAAGDRALRAGEVDVSQQFISQVWTMWQQDRLPISTFIPQAPYFFPGQTPHLVYNTVRPGLDDAVVRRAINLSMDYPAMAANAASNYSVPTQPHMMVPIPAELNLVDMNALRQYQWSENRTERLAQANRELDAAGWTRGTDGIRARGGVRLAFSAECPTGWSDYQATLEIVSQAARDVGIQITTSFPTTAIYDQNRDNGTFDIQLRGASSVGPENPIGRIRILMGSEELPPVGTPNNVQNFGRWINQEANQLIQQAQAETDINRLRQIYTRLNIIYLQEAPFGITWYRPLRFHTVNSSVWEGFPVLGDGTNIPPTLLIDGYGFHGLFNIRPRQ